MSPLQCDDIQKYTYIYDDIFIENISIGDISIKKTFPDSCGPKKRYELSGLRILTRISDKCDNK